MVQVGMDPEGDKYARYKIAVDDVASALVLVVTPLDTLLQSYVLQ